MSRVSSSVIWCPPCEEPCSVESLCRGCREERRHHDLHVWARDNPQVPMLGQPDSDERLALLGNMALTLREARETINRYEQALERIADRDRYKVTGAEGRYLARIARRALSERADT